MIAALLTIATLILPQVSGVYQGPGCEGHSARPPSSYTSRLKVEQIRELGYTDTDPSDYQEDHLVSLALGGHPTDSKNLWPQPWPQAHRDDRIELELWHRACRGIGRPLTVREAVRWERQWKKTHG
jgi:hypothetical protein